MDARDDAWLEALSIANVEVHDLRTENMRLRKLLHEVRCNAVLAGEVVGGRAVWVATDTWDAICAVDARTEQVQP